MAMGYAGSDIVRYAEFALKNTEDSFRNEVLNTVISIVRSVENAKVTNTD